MIMSGITNFSLGVGAFVIGLNQILSFFSSYAHMTHLSILLEFALHVIVIFLNIGLIISFVLVC